MPVILKAVTESQEVGALVGAMAEVSQLTSDPKSSLEVTADTVRIGGIVLKRRA